MYHPAPPSVSEIAAGFSNDDEFEFIEIGNVSGKTLLLDGIRFTKGIDMTLEGSLPPGAAALLVANREAFEFRYGDGFNILGEWQNGDRLDNGGELIRLRDARNRIIQEFTYDDRGLWPQSPDGNGPSLVLIAPASFPNHDLAGNWRPSSTPGGNPGGSDATTFPGGTSAELLAYATRGDLQREVLPDGNYAFTLDRNLLADDVIIHLETSTDLQEWHNASDIFSRSALGPLDGSFSKVTFTTTEAPNSPRFFLRYRIELR
jgi:hypothetical protein